MAAGPARILLGQFACDIVEGELRGLRFAGHEVLRRISYPVRDENWGTYAVITTAEEVQPDGYHRHFADPSGLFRGSFRLALQGDSRLALSLRLVFTRPARINRAGFAVLHPLIGVEGTPLLVTCPDGSQVSTAFPSLISPTQPARDIAGLRHQVGPVSVDIAFTGEVFEMEDQRNWSDASFKTYCRPLSQPRPFGVVAGEEMSQDITLHFAAEPITSTVVPSAMSGTARLPQVLLAHQPGLSTTAALDAFPDVPVLLRMDSSVLDADLAALAMRQDVAIELVFDSMADLQTLIHRLHAAELSPLRLTGLPRSYLASHQPEGPWPRGPAPRDAIAPLRAAFPGVPVGSGSLTNFTEFNRCPPDPLADFATFGTTAIVHAADDQSVRETIEALPAIFATAQALSPGKPLHLGLFSIGMRSNPYGEDVLPNPDGQRLPMARQDPRQHLDFAASHALDVVLEAARAGVDSIALAMPDGPLGAGNTPLGRMIKHLAPHGGQQITWQKGASRRRISTLDLPIADPDGAVADL